MYSFDIICSTSYDTFGMLKVILNGLELAENAIKAVRLNIEGLPQENDWAVVFECSDPAVLSAFEIRMKNLTCGYNGSGPNDLIKCFRLAGFDESYISSEEVYREKTLNKVIFKK